MPNHTKKIKQAAVTQELHLKQELATRLEKPPKRSEKGTFLIGHEYALKYPPLVAKSLFERIYQTLIKDEGTNELNLDNPVRANTIKLIKEACLCCGISHKCYIRLRRIYCTRADEYGDQNPLFDAAIVELVEKIEEICEARLSYSGQFMDIFILKNHYGYVDRQEVTHILETPVVFFTLPDGTKLPI